MPFFFFVAESTLTPIPIRLSFLTRLLNQNSNHANQNADNPLPWQEMKWIILLSVILLSYLAAAIPIDNEGVIAASEAVIEVTVDENGRTLSVETITPTATADNASICTCNM